MPEGKLIHELKIGDSAQISKTITESDIELFAKATGDFNPVHLDQAYAEKTSFKGRIAHGLLSVGLLSDCLGKYSSRTWNHLPFARGQVSCAR